MTTDNELTGTMYEYLQRCESTDTYDSTYDDGLCWDRIDEDEDICDRCCIAIQKRVKCVREGAPYSTVADISAFVKKYMHVLEPVSREHKWPMESADPEDEDAVYHGVTLVNAMMAGYASDDEYEAVFDGIMSADGFQKITDGFQKIGEAM